MLDSITSTQSLHPQRCSRGVSFSKRQKIAGLLAILLSLSVSTRFFCPGIPTHGVAKPLGSTIIDTSSSSATRDGTIIPGEYIGSTTGINSGFGDVIGTSSQMNIDSSSSGGVNIGLIKGPGAYNDALVIYLDTDGGGTGFSTTSGFTDTADSCRKAISGYDGVNRSTLNFAPGFKADYAICMDNTLAGLWKLANGGSHTYVTNLHRTTLTSGHYEIEFSLANLGLGPGSAFDYAATYLNPVNAYRSDEFNGVTTFIGGNPGYTTVSLETGDFNTFLTVPGVVSPSSALGGDGPGGIGVKNGSSNLKLWLKGSHGAYTDTACSSAAGSGNAVACWADQSGYLDNASMSTSSLRPLYQTNVVNGQAVLRFDADDGMMINDSLSLAAPYTVLTVFDRNEPIPTNSRAIQGRDANWLIGPYRSWIAHHAGSWVSNNYVLTIGQFYIATANNTASASTFWVDGVNRTQSSSGVTPPGRLGLGTSGQWNEALRGDLGEVIVYNINLNSAQRIIVENSLSARYNLTYANDFYNGDTAGNGDFDLDVAGVGWNGSDRHVQAHSAGIIVRNASFLQSSGDWLLFGHKDAASTQTIADLPSDGEWLGAPSQRWGRHWYFNVTNAGGNGGKVDIIFDLSEYGVTGFTPSGVNNYRLLKRSATSGQFSDITSASGARVAVVSDQIQFLGVDASQLGSNFTIGTLDNINSPLGPEAPTAVMLAYFEVTPFANQAWITWQTTFEIDTSGFNLYRSTDPDEERTKINPSMIPPKALGLPTGASYRYIDANLTPGKEYFYWLEVVNHDPPQLFGPVAIMGQYWIHLPMITSTNQ